MPDIRDRLFYPLSKTENISEIIEYLLLFDTLIIGSNQLQEIPAFVKLFVCEGLRDLLKTGSLRMAFDYFSSIGQVGQLSAYRAEKGILPPNCYSFAVVELSKRETHIHSYFKEIEKIEGLSWKARVKLKGIVSDNLLDYPLSADFEVLNQFKQELKRNDLSLKMSLLKAVHIKKELNLMYDQIEISTEQINEDDFSVATNLGDLLNINKVEVHKLVEGALLGLIGSGKTLSKMKTFNSLIGFRDDEVNVFESKLDFLLNQFNLNKRLASLRRVIEISGLPNLKEAISDDKIDIDRLLKVRESNECKEFRCWLWSIESETDEEIKEHVNAFREKIGEFYRSPLGKTIRWITGVGTGLIPIAGFAISASLGAIDTFLLEKLIPNKGALVFLNQKLPSIYLET